MNVTKVKQQYYPYQEYDDGHYHRCNRLKWPEEHRWDTDYDRLIWPVGSQGQGYPKGIPFPVRTVCPACGDLVTRWFAWA